MGDIPASYVILPEGKVSPTFTFLSLYVAQLLQIGYIKTEWPWESSGLDGL